MMQPKNDPFFEQLKADIQEGLEELDRDESYSLDEVEQHLDAVRDSVSRQKSQGKGS